MEPPVEDTQNILGGTSTWHASRYARLGGVCLLLLAVFAALSLSAYFSTGIADQSIVEHYLQGKGLSDRTVENWMGFVGALLAHFLVFEGFGISSAFLILVVAMVGIALLGLRLRVSWQRLVPWCCFMLFWGSMCLGYVAIERVDLPLLSHWSGGIGYVLALFVHNLVGRGTVFVLGFIPLLLLLRAFGFTYRMLLPRKKEDLPDPIPERSPERLLERPKEHSLAPLDASDTPPAQENTSPLLESETPIPLISAPEAATPDPSPRTPTNRQQTS